MFIKTGLKIGDTVVLTKDMEVLAGTFTKGHELKVIGCSNRGYDFEDADGNRLLETGLSNNFYMEKSNGNA